VGPMVREESLHKLDRQVKDSVKMGAKVETGGERLKRRGFFYAPTILTAVDPEMPVMKEETFGPAAPVMIVKDDDEAVRYANNSEFGLGSSVWRRDIRRAEKAARQWQPGMFSVHKRAGSDPRLRVAV